MNQKRIIHILLVIFVIFLNFECYSQLRCGTMERYKFEIYNNPDYQNTRQILENKIQKWQENYNNNSYIIPVVFHVIYENESENISTEKLLSQLDILNKDFNRNNIDANQTPEMFQNFAADCNISFCLAQRTPNNDVSTGITYTQTNINSFSLYDNRIFHDSLGGKTIWNSNKYLNIYVCDLTNALGFSSFPGSNPMRDAVVINYENIGNIGITPPFNKGRTGTHEVGHWFNLLHIWGDGNCGNDLVEDTPIQENENYGCPSHPSPTCNNNGDMFQNFMDYTDDGCMNLFTNGQKNRMHATINNLRSELINSQGCHLPYEDIGINENISPFNNQEFCGKEINIITSLFNFSNKPIFSSEIYYQIDNNNFQMIEWNGNLLPNSSIEINLGLENLEIGDHTLKIYSSSPNGFRDLNTSNDTIIINFKIIDGNLFEFEIITDNYADENHWEIINSNNEIITSENQLISNSINYFTFCQEIDSCYTLIIYDNYDDGICCEFGNGYIIANDQIISGNFNSQINIDLCSTISIKENEKKSRITLFPNPTSNWLNIKSDENIVSIRIYDLLGRIVFNKNCNSKLDKLNLQSINNGKYFIQIITQNNFNFFEKIIIK